MSLLRSAVLRICLASTSLFPAFRDLLHFEFEALCSVRRSSRRLFIIMILCGVAGHLRILPVDGLKACMYSSTAKTTMHSCRPRRRI